MHLFFIFSIAMLHRAAWTGGGSSLTQRELRLPSLFISNFRAKSKFLVMIYLSVFRIAVYGHQNVFHTPHSRSVIKKIDIVSHNYPYYNWFYRKKQDIVRRVHIKMKDKVFHNDMILPR
jgi:hypothetical protein